MTEPVTIQFTVTSSGDREADAIAAIGQILKWVNYDNDPDGVTDDAAVIRICNYISRRWGAG
jgi:hypothetical protein